MSATISAIGIYVPDTKIDNSYFEKILDTNDTWIRQRTGIINRYFAKEDEFTSDLCIKAVKNLIENNDADVSNVDFIIVATSTPDYTMPSVASQVQASFNISKAGCMDISAACAGFVYGIILAKGLIASGANKKVLIIGAETLSKVINLEDRTSCILFGDGAGAVIVEASAENHIFQSITETEGILGQNLYLSNLPAAINGQKITGDNKIHQNGRAVFKWAVSTLVEKIRELSELNERKLDKVDWLIPHSANLRILEAVCETLDFPIEKCLESIRNYGNTSAASIPIAWFNGLKSGKVKPDDIIIFAGFGGGLTSASICIQNKIALKR
ncbi:ketoacyl-ACP synthase III [Dyadobacter psychrotolerans]|uniref:Beta-ketoacyl-[acyl-carrier-protein] synthase III n=1 Tax=Dyadobacter psychrotolerans TaxID=2541721 RepID=A0A4R5DMV3_9BACT|nr:ketoacyl-ACP synthase III [Dyadobacter psychrotolerans]TDE15636.1 ketoacyl-ACP synthase III [Dyadobacter psychrotolerans]